MEIEAKFAIRDMQTYQELQILERIACFSMAESTSRDLFDTYFDTADRRMLRAGYACRMREGHGDVIITLKSVISATENGVHRREELEIELPEALPLDQWPEGQVRQRVLALIQDTPLTPLFSLTQRRIARPVFLNQRHVAEFCLDAVTLHNDGEHTGYELEVEIEGQGTEADLEAIVAHLRTLPGLTPEFRSKFERGLLHIDARTARAKTSGILPDDTMAEAARKTLCFHFQQMLTNEDETREGNNVEALHDMRVATRRMRTTFRVFERDLDMPTMTPFLKGLRQVGRALGDVRDMDVFRENGQAYLDTLPAEQKPDLTRLFCAWDAAYANARARMLKHLDLRRYARFKETFGDYLAQPFPTGDTRSIREAMPDLMAGCLSDFYACKARIDAANTDVTSYHQLRIATKHVRYTLEYFREVLGSECKEAIGKLKALQDHLGTLQDAVVAGMRLDNVTTWGTWDAPATPYQRWNDAALVAPDVAAYRAFQQAEVRRRINTFPKKWTYYQSEDFQQLITNAITALTSKTY